MKRGGRKELKCFENQDYDLMRHMAMTVLLRMMGTKGLHERAVCEPHQAGRGGVIFGVVYT